MCRVHCADCEMWARTGESACGLCHLEPRALETLANHWCSKGVLAVIEAERPDGPTDEEIRGESVTLEGFDEVVPLAESETNPETPTPVKKSAKSKKR